MINCPIKESCYPGNCQFCDQRMDCILLAILQKLEKLEVALSEIQPKVMV